MRPSRLMRSAIVLKPSTIMSFRRALDGAPLDALAETTNNMTTSLDEYRQQHPNRDLLRELAEGTGGQLDPQPEDLLAQKQAGTRKLLHPMENMMMIAAVFLLLGDISLRTLFGPPAE